MSPSDRIISSLAGRIDEMSHLIEKFDHTEAAKLGELVAEVQQIGELLADIADDPAFGQLDSKIREKVLEYLPDSGPVNKGES